MHPAFLYLPGQRLTLPELTAARLDGDVVDIGEAFIPADLVEGADVRAASIATIVHPGTAVCGPSAVWVHGACDAPPNPHHLRRAVARRIRAVQSPRVRYHDTPLPAEDLVLIGGIPITTPERTLIDLALGSHREPALDRWAHMLIEHDPGLIGTARERIRTLRRVPGSRRALELLEGLGIRRT
ncbi:SAM-dependent methyltransferase [Microbacterium sp. kSW2-24]|uniref:type IV toxin-antitoxin system AbiEi family antitoxin n=1 Tax=Microbacterium galbinum TaxID=2851646 RepID=UPI001FFDAE9D|nr:type IV toxin-antitoxin system AbiEi family antitoxin [Microbacterium galbinum]MCK2021717.1 SAM-dependent methyltransferase [Microbacterium galbinum]